MLHGNHSISHYSRSNVIIWLIMAFQAGVLNIGGLMAGHHIVSHVTGFATFFGLHGSRSEFFDALKMLIIPVFFLLGAVVSGYFVDIRLRLKKRPKYYITFGIMFFLNIVILTAGLLGYWGEFGAEAETLHEYVLLILLCFVCGIQNGTISVVSRSIIRTTHLTGITTDLGLGIIRFIKRNELADQLPDEGRANLMRLGIISFFILGSAIGGAIFHHFHFYGFILPTAISGGLFYLMAYYQMRD
jgi:uncharacterized membrane protein YoaK (UPF0700 family)